MAFHGDQDPFVSYQDQRGDAVEIADRHWWHGSIPDGVIRHDGAEAAMSRWASHNGCDPDPEVTTVGTTVRRSSWRNCQAETVFFHVPGGGHTWPGRPVAGMEAVFGSTTLDVDASAAMFEFFFSHRLSGRR